MVIAFCTPPNNHCVPLEGWGSRERATGKYYPEQWSLIQLETEVEKK